MTFILIDSNRNIVTSEDQTNINELCKTQLGGEWAEVSPEELIIKPDPNGFVNKLYYCFLPDHVQTRNNKLVIRYVDFKALGNFLESTHLTAIELVMSENGVSPRVFSFFDGGTIIKYIQGRYFDANDDLNNKSVELLAQKVAKLHSLEAPIPKNSVDDTNDMFFHKWFNQELKQSYINGVVRQFIEEDKYPVLSKLDLIYEMNWLRKTMEELNSPIVLSHNDLNRRNILVRQENVHDELEIFIIDFDWANYNWRGVDLGQYFAGYRQIEADFGYVNLPSDEVMSVFIDAYIKEMTELVDSSYAEQEINSRDRLIKEAKVFALFGFIKDIQYLLEVPSKTKNKELMVKAEERLLCYDELKNRILEEYTDITL